MTPTAVLRTPPASTSYHRDYLSLRPPRGDKEKDFRHDSCLSPTTSAPFANIKSPPERSVCDSPLQPSPSPLRKRVLFERGSSGQCDSDEDEDEPSPSLNRLHSPFMSRCASPFLGAWGKRDSKLPLSNQLTEDDEGLFLTSKTTGTPTCTPLRDVAPNSGCKVNSQTLSPGTPGLAKLILTPTPSKNHPFVFRSPVRPSLGLTTPGFEPSQHSSWPRADLAECQRGEVDEFILKTLVAGNAPTKDKKTVPGTPVKRNAYAYLRPWMSSSKAIPPPALPPESGVPRKSLPLSFPNLSQIQQSPDGSDTSPSDRYFAHRKMYGDVGRGRPGMLLSRGGSHPADSKMQLLMRRSSSGAFSSSSSSEGSLLGTPTKPMVPSTYGRQTNTPQARKSPTKRPAYGRYSGYEHGYRMSPGPSFGILPRPHSEHERPGKFETDFVTIDTLGTGEFGSVLKVRYKRGEEKHVFAVKKSKRFEGVKHRRRLREEVVVLQHLALKGGACGHPNVLKYIDSWEQDDGLYIQTELCELGNFGNFLAEYGAHFEALNEARVWKICAELSNGLRFIHDAGVIHLDLKPANIFVTCEGRFRIGDFGMASLWPRRDDDGFEREGDREYLAPEVLQGSYGKAADIFSFGMIMLETATNIVVPDMGDDWHRLREDDFSAVDFAASENGSLAYPRSAELIDLIVQMMRSDPNKRLTIEHVYMHPVVQRARDAMDRKLATALANGSYVFGASPLGGEPETYLEEILQIRPPNCMDLSA